VDSSPVTLTVIGPLQIQSVAVANGATFIGWTTIPGDNYALQAKSNLNDANWVQLQTVAASSSLTTISNSIGNSSQRFYRLVLLP